MFEPDDADKLQEARWTEEHRAVAKEQGWDLFDYDGSGLLQIQRVDEDERDLFAGDDENAVAHVRSEAGKGCPTAALAGELEDYFAPRILEYRERAAPAPRP